MQSNPKLTLPEHSLVLLTIPPYFNLPSMSTISLPNKRLIIFDTVGNFYLAGSECHFISTLDELFESLVQLKHERDFVLLIDTLTFLIDIGLPFMECRRYFNLLWELIYENNAEVIVVDHYKSVKVDDKFVIRPRFYQSLKIFTHSILIEDNGEMDIREI